MADVDGDDVKVQLFSADAATDKSIKQHQELGASSTSTAAKQKKAFFLFSHMADFPWPYLLVIPVAFAVLIGYGWTVDNKIEEQVANLWIAQDGDYYNDQQYASSFNREDLSSSSFAALAISRDGGNIMTASRLEEIRARMEQAEGTTLEYMGNNYTWDDLCAVNSAPYQFPCLRLSAMDLFQEARWTFSVPEKVGYYRNVIQDSLIAPRLPRFGVMTSLCTSPCGFLLTYRTNPAALGFPAELASPLSLFADVGNLEYNDPCRICIESNYTSTIEGLYVGVSAGFTALRGAVLQTQAAVVDDAAREQLQVIADNLQAILDTVTKDDVNEFYSYYVARGLYGQLGVQGYLRSYAAFNDSIATCQAVGLVCPPAVADVDAAMAAQHLLNHADNAFSSVTTSGAPFPFWSQPDGTGSLFQANPDTGAIYPVSGSGVDMSADLRSLNAYFGYLQNSSSPVDPNSQEWQDLVETNPLYAWFMASLTAAEDGTLCGNGNLTGTNSGNPALDQGSAALLAASTARWCTYFDVPNPISRPEGVTFSKQHFARMWYDLLFASDSFLGVQQGADDPYSWTTGAGCDYNLGGERFSYTGQSDQDILHNASRLVYNIDEGVTLGAVDRSLLIGGAIPAIGEYSFENPLKEVRVIQSLYAALVAKNIVRRVANCNRPGGPIDLTEEEAKGVLKAWKEAMENSWNKGWDDDSAGEVQFVSFFDDGGGAVGSTGRMLTEITLDNNTLMAISIIIIALFSAMFLFSFDLVESRVLITMVGVALVILSYFAGLGFSLLVNIKINVSIAWTLPFVMIGLGVDDVYIVLLAMKKQGGYTKAHYLKAMNEVAVPVTMTSFVNASMFAIMNVSDIPAIYETSRVACYCIIALYLSVILCFPAYCYLDLRRQAANRMDVLICLKSSNPPVEGQHEDIASTYLYFKFYRPIVLAGNPTCRYLVHLAIAVVSAAVFSVGIYGITERDIGLGLEDFFPESNPAGRWAQLRTDELASWSVGINWGALNYTDPITQMKMIKQFEDVVATPHIAEVDTKQMWMADFAIWTSRHCNENFVRDTFDAENCGRDLMFEEGSYCAGTWVTNEFGLREKSFQDITDSTCLVNEGGVCRPGSQMHSDDLSDIGLNATSDIDNVSFCPVIQGWSDDKWKFCLRQWRNITGGAGTRFLLEEEQGSPTECSGVFNRDENVAWPILLSDGPGMFAVDLYSHQLTLDMMSETRAVCDDHPELHCWMSGIPFDYWTQYEGIFEVLLGLCGYATLAGFGISAIVLFATLCYEANHPMGQILIGSLLGAFLIAVSILLTLVTVVGLSILFDVSLTGFSVLAFVLSVGFVVEYAVHIVSRWMRANMSHKTSLDRVAYTMSFLMLPTFMSFASSTIGVICLAFTEFDFNKVFFFRPLMIVMFASYWFGCWFLPTLLIYVDLDVVKLGKPVEDTPVEVNKEMDRAGAGHDDDDDGVEQSSALDEEPQTSSNEGPEVSDDGFHEVED